jgi:hypothetical protein
MSSASSLEIDGGFADFPPIVTTRAGFWYVGLLAAVTWAMAAAVIHTLPDIDDFERTHLLAQIAGGFAAVLFAGVVAERLFRFTLPAKLRSAGPWLVMVSLVLIG